LKFAPFGVTLIMKLAKNSGDRIMIVVISNLGARTSVVSGDTDTSTSVQKSFRHLRMTRFTRLILCASISNDQNTNRSNVLISDETHEQLTFEAN
jgi:hypothetical protein